MSGAASGEIMNLIIARAASGSFELVATPTSDWHRLFTAAGSGPTKSTPGTPDMMLDC